MNDPDRSPKVLLAAIDADDKHADELAGYAKNLRSAGHKDAAARVLQFSRQYRISALDKRGRLAALVFASPDDL